MPTTRRELATWLGTTIGTGVLFVTYVAVAGIHPLWLLAAFFVEGSVGGLLGYWFIRRESPFFLRLTQGLLVGGVTALPVAGFAYVVGYYSLPSVGETSSYIV